tara:strand:- start:45547 stop:46977 length:1431 start_codon:yes stop_codon:yes gene_type:complete
MTKIKNYQRTKVVATIGPKTANSKKLKMMHKAGMSVARLNGSHNSLDWHSNTIRLIKSILPNLPILIDIPGKKIRTTILQYEPSFSISDEIILTTNKKYNGKDKVPITNNLLHKYISKNDVVLADDGTLKFKVIKVVGKDIYLKALTKGVLKSSKGINVPHITMGGALITKRDIKMIEFAKSKDVDFVGISFVESRKHIKKIRNLINSHSPYIVAKVENQKGLQNLEEIIDEADAIMIDRGDLSTETNIENLAINQKNIIKTANANSTPVIVATEMLDNMINNPYPTKAEVLDISNSILDGASATMLSGETAVGAYPVESIKVMSNISSSLVTDEISKYKIFNKHTSSLASGKAISVLCSLLPITKIVAITMSGHAARIISSQMLSQPIIAVSNDKKVSRSLNLLSGTKGIFYDTKFYKDNLNHIPKCLFHLWKNKEILESDMILVTALGYPGSGHRMNLIQTHSVKDLKKLFSWK